MYSYWQRLINKVLQLRAYIPKIRKFDETFLRTYFVSLRIEFYVLRINNPSYDYNIIFSPVHIITDDDDNHVIIIIQEFKYLKVPFGLYKEEDTQ